MKRYLTITGILFLLAVSTASAGSLWFNQDDYWNYYSNGNPGAAGNVAISTGSILDFNNPANILGSFYIYGISAGAVADGSGNYKTVYSASLTISLTAGPVLGTWVGAGSFYTLAAFPNPDVPPAGQYLTSGYAAPAGYPLGANNLFKSVGAGSFNFTDGTLAFSTINLDWFGTYNWRYGNTPNPPWNKPPEGDPSGFANYQLGNAQGVFSVPEPGLILLLGFGLAAVSATSFARRFLK